MPPRSKISRLPIKKMKHVDKIVADNTKTLTEKHQALLDEGFDISKSALQRYTKKLEATMIETQHFNDVARTIAEKNKAGGAVIVSETIITMLQSKILKLILEDKNQIEDPKILTSYVAMVTKIANALVDLNKLPKNVAENELEDKVSELVQEHIKKIKTPETKQQVADEKTNAKPKRNK